jgi:hypothetical protein
MKCLVILLMTFVITPYLFSQTTNNNDTAATVRRYDKMTIERTLNYTRNTYTPPGGMKNTGFSSSSVYICINGITMEPAGWHYKNLKHYFLACDEAMKHYEAAIRHLKANQIGLYSGLGVAAAGGIILGSKGKSNSTGIGLLAVGGGLIVAGMVEEALERHSIKKAVQAYNKWQKNRL